jgi:diguanylate cyclase (GGDEF)-like protein
MTDGLISGENLAPSAQEADVVISESAPLAPRATGLRKIMRRAQEIRAERVKIRPNENPVKAREHSVSTALLEHKNEQLEEAKTDADHDHLTRLLNRRGFLKAFDRDVARIHRANFARAHNNPGAPEEKSSILFFDLNKLKQTNEISHDAGDALLLSLAKVLNDSARPQDIAARWGGDEFVKVLSGNDLTAAKLYWKNILAPALADQEVQVSVGICEIDPKSPHGSLALADQLQLMAKGISRENSDTTQMVPAEQ